MSCISCDSPNNLIKNNNIMYCNRCYNQMMTLLLKFDKESELSRKKTYIPPTKIIDNIYIGCIDSVNEVELKNLGITNIIIAGNRLKNDNHNNFDYIELMINDSLEQDIIESVSICNNYIDSSLNSKFLIHCYSGISRSASILIGYIMHKLNMNYDDAYMFVKDKYPKAYPNESFILQLKSL